MGIGAAAINLLSALPRAGVKTLDNGYYRVLSFPPSKTPRVTAPPAKSQYQASSRGTFDTRVSHHEPSLVARLPQGAGPTHPDD